MKILSRNQGAAVSCDLCVLCLFDDLIYFFGKNNTCHDVLTTWNIREGGARAQHSNGSSSAKDYTFA